MPPFALPGIVTRTVLRVRDGAARSDEDTLAVEEPLEIRLDLGHHVQRLAITMRTPGHDADLAVGFLVGEGVLTSPGDVVETRPGARDCGLPDPNVVVVRLRDGLAFDAARLERHVYTTSSCGVCGKASLEAVRVIAGPGLPEGPTLCPDVLCALPDTLRRQQAVFEQTGGLHAAALFDADGGLLRVREDVGRHNAVDKLVGSFWLDGCAVPPGVLLVSGRASFELVQKALAAGIPILAAVGAPSSLAVDLAADHGLTLVGFLRDGRFNLYAGAGRVRTGAAPPRT